MPYFCEMASTSRADEIRRTVSPLIRGSARAARTGRRRVRPGGRPAAPVDVGGRQRLDVHPRFPSSRAFFGKRVTKSSHFIHQARHSLSRHRDEGCILVPAFITRVNIARMLHQRCGNDFPVIKIRPSLGATSIGNGTHSHKIHRMVIVQGPDEPGPRSSRRTQLIDLFELTFTHADTFHQRTQGWPARDHADHPRPNYVLISLARISEPLNILEEPLVVCNYGQPVLYSRMQDRGIIIGNHRVERLPLPHTP